MKTALDFYVRGKQKETSADEYNSHGYFPKGRFICPECGEPVYIRPSKYANFFVHYKKTDETEECDRRVDGESHESVYERLGLPLYIREFQDKEFKLLMGFKSLPEDLILQAEKSKASISFENSERYLINRERFSAEMTSMIPIGYIPQGGNNYCLSIKPSEFAQKVKKHWSNYADGFSLDGALFSITEQGGRKIRHGDIISTDTEYYWVRRQKGVPTNYRGIHMELYGRLCIKDRIWNVYKGHFSSEISDYEYARLSDYLRENLRLHLLEKAPEFIPIWPPLIKREDGYAYDSECKRIYGKVISGNEEPKAYVYRGVSCEPEVMFTNNIMEVQTRGNRLVVNIDRKYISGGAYFYEGKGSFEGIDNVVSISYEDKKLIVCDLDSKQMIYIKKSGELSKIQKEKDVTIENIANGDVIVVLSHGNLVAYEKIEIYEEEADYINEKWLYRIMVKYDKAGKVCLPSTIGRWLMRLEITDPRLKMKIQQIVRETKLSKVLVPILEECVNARLK